MIGFKKVKEIFAYLENFKKKCVFIIKLIRFINDGDNNVDYY